MCQNYGIAKLKRMGLRWPLTVFIFLVTFGLLLPVFLHHRVYSIYYRMDKNQVKLVEFNRNTARRNIANEYLQSLNPSDVYRFHSNRIQRGNLDFAIVVITVLRKDSQLGYLSQVAAAAHHEVTISPRVRAAMLLCNVEAKPRNHLEAKKLSLYFPTVVRYDSGDPRNLAVFDKEKEDYLYCLGIGQDTNASYVLLLEDDSVPVEHMLSSLKFIVETKIQRVMNRGQLVPNNEFWVATKLYYPERWMGFAKEPRRILELIGIGSLGGGIFLGTAVFLSNCFKSTPHSLLMKNILFVIGAIYLVCLAIAIGRQNVLNLLRLHPMLFRVSHAPGCCTPATLFPRIQVNGVIRFLTTIKCTKDYGVDLALDDYAKRKGLAIYSVEPNLFNHVGLYSTLTGEAKNIVEEFLF